MEVDGTSRIEVVSSSASSPRSMHSERSPCIRADLRLEVSVIGFDDHRLAARTSPPRTTVAQPLVREGEVAVGQLEGCAPRTDVLPWSVGVGRN